MWSKNGEPQLIDSKTKDIYYTTDFVSGPTPIDSRTLKFAFPGKSQKQINQKLTEDENELEYAQDFQKKSLFLENSRLLPALGYREWDGHIFVCGSTRSGKSWVIKDMLLLDKKKRDIFLITDLQDKDPSLKELYKSGRMKRVMKNPIDHSTDITVRKFESHMRGSFVIFDDVSPHNREINGFRDRLLEKGRHKEVTAIVVSHSMRDYNKTKAPLTDSEWIICFPGSNFSAVSGFLRDRMRMTGAQIRMFMSQASRDGRHMSMHLWNPNFIATEKTAFIS